MGIVRAETIARMRKAFAEGLSASRFITEMRAIGLSYRRTEMLADWREVGEIKKKEGLARFVRKGYVPAENTATLKTWAMSREYMYKLRYERTMYPGEPVEPKFVNLMSDVPLTIEEIETQAWERSFEQSPMLAGEARQFIVETAIRRVIE